MQWLTVGNFVSKSGKNIGHVKLTKHYKLFMSMDGKYTSISKSVLIENYLYMMYPCPNDLVVKVLDFYLHG